MAKLGTGGRALTALAALVITGAGHGLAAADPTPAPYSPDGRTSRGMAPQQLFGRLYQDSRRASQAARRQVSFDVPSSQADTAGALADAAGPACDAIVALATRPDGVSLVKRISSVTIVVRPAPAVDVAGGAVTIAVAPSEGAAGRPSSISIERAIAAAQSAPQAEM